MAVALAGLVIVLLALGAPAVLAAGPSPKPVVHRPTAAPASPATRPSAPAAGATAAPGSSAPAPGEAGPPFPPPPASYDVHVIDTIGAFSPDARQNAEALIAPIADATGATVVVYTQRKAVSGTDEAAQDAQALLAQWQPGGSDQNVAILLFDINPEIRNSHAGIAVGGGFAPFLPEDERSAIVDDSMAGYLQDGNLDAALTAGLSRLDLDATVMASGGCVGSACPTPEPTIPGASAPPTAPGETPNPEPSAFPTASPAPVVVPAGPPYPAPVTGRRVYDFAGVFDAGTIARLQATADGIEQRTGAQVVVYTQVKPGVDTGEAEADAQALMDQWGVGRKGFDDGLVILFDLDHSLRHGQVQLYAGPGFRSTFLTNDERQSIYQDDMLPYLRAGDMDGAVLIAMSKVDAAATPSHAQSLETARQINSVMGLVLAPLIFLLLAGWVFFAWFRHGRDPHYIDDPSIYVAGPPAALTPASGAFLVDGGPSRRALTTALLDLASRGEISFREATAQEPGSVVLDAVHGNTDSASAKIADARPMGPAEHAALLDLRSLAKGQPDGQLSGTELLRFGASVDTFNAALERQVIAGGWYQEAPRLSRGRWLGRASLEIFGAIVLYFIAAIIVASGLGLIAVAIGAAGIVTLIMAFSMPARTMAGAMVVAMLTAYRRTLAATMTTARSLNQVVTDAKLQWLQTPDQAMVWGTALGLQSELAAVLGRSLADVQATPAAASSVYFPSWYASSAFAGSGAGSTGSAAGHAEPAGGLFSPSVVPDFGSMFAALGTIGDSPASTSSGGGSSGGGSFSSGGDFGGGSSGGGGGGAGGGF